MGQSLSLCGSRRHLASPSFSHTDYSTEEEIQQLAPVMILDSQSRMIKEQQQQQQQQHSIHEKKDEEEIYHFQVQYDQDFDPNDSDIDDDDDDDDEEAEAAVVTGRYQRRKKHHHYSHPHHQRHHRSRHLHHPLTQPKVFYRHHQYASQQRFISSSPVSAQNSLTSTVSASSSSISLSSNSSSPSSDNTNATYYTTDEESPPLSSASFSSQSSPSTTITTSTSTTINGETTVIQQLHSKPSVATSTLSARATAPSTFVALVTAPQHKTHHSSSSLSNSVPQRHRHLSSSASATSLSQQPQQHQQQQQKLTIARAEPATPSQSLAQTFVPAVCSSSASLSHSRSHTQLSSASFAQEQQVLRDSQPIITHNASIQIQADVDDSPALITASESAQQQPQTVSQSQVPKVYRSHRKPLNFDNHLTIQSIQNKSLASSASADVSPAHKVEDDSPFEAGSRSIFSPAKPLSFTYHKKIDRPIDASPEIIPVSPTSHPATALTFMKQTRFSMIV